MNRRQLQPYPGLRPFERSESRIFFGRQKQVDDLLQRLKEQHFLAVLGSSGSGKSSLVKAGLLPGLEKGYMGEVGASWRITEMRPGDLPFERLSEGLLKQQTDGQDKVAWLAALLRRGSRSLHDYLSQSPLEEGQKLLILVDQFEEIFRYRQQSGNQAAAFVALLLEASRHTDIYVVITMRSDFLGEATSFHGLPEAINDGLYLTPRLTRDQLKQAISLPATLFSGKVDDALVNRFLNEAGNDPDQLPLLQHALMRLWVEDDDKILTLQAFEARKGLQGSLNGHMEQVYGVLIPEQQAIAEALFRALTARGEDGQTIRRPATFEEVMELAQCGAQDLTSVVEAFRGDGRHFLMASSPELTAETVLDISHESLIRNWGRLETWVEDESEKAKQYSRLVDISQRLTKADESYNEQRGELLYGTDLAIGLAWQRDTKPDAVWAKRYLIDNENKFELVQDVLQASETEEIAQREAEQARQKETLARVRRQFMYAFVGLLIAAVLAGWGFIERQRAEKQTAMATEAAEQAKSEKDRAQQEAKRADAESERAKASEAVRTLELFNAGTTHASLLTRVDDFAAARKKLNKTRSLNDDVPVERTNARDLLAGYVDIMGGEAEQTFTDSDGKPLPQLNGSVDISSDGKWLAASGERGTIALFDRTSGKLLQKLEGHNTDTSRLGVVFSIVFHPNNLWLFSTGADGQIIQWQLPQGDTPAHLLDQWSVDVASRALALTPDGKVLASGHTDGSIRLWELAQNERKPLRVLKGHEETIRGLAFNSQGWLASASYDKTVLLWDWQAREGRVLRGHDHYVQNVAFSSNGQWLASSSSDQSIILWDVESGRAIQRLKGHQNMVTGLQFINDKLLSSASSDATVRLWDVETGINQRVLQGHAAAVVGLALHKDSGKLYSTSNDGTVKQWNAALPRQWLLDLPSEPTPTAISPNGKLVVVGFNDGDLRIYSLGKHIKLLHKYTEAHADRLIRLAFNADGTQLAAGDLGGTAKVWSVNANGELKLLHTFDDHKDVVHAIAFSPDDTHLATASYDGQIGLFDLKNGEGELFEAHQGNVSSVSFDSSGKRLLSTGNNDFKLKLWNLDTQPPTATTQATANNALLWASLSPDGKQIASVGREYPVSIYPINGKQAPLRLQGHEQAVFKAIFSPDSRQLATVSGDMTVRLWDLDTQSELFSLRLPANITGSSPLWDFDFRCTPTGCWIAVPLTSGKLGLYNLGKIDYKQLPGHKMK